MPKRIKREPKPKPEYRVRIVYDPDFVPTGVDDAPLPEPEREYRENPYMVLINPADDPKAGERREATYEEYCEYYGNPDRHVGLAVMVDRKCPCCGEWAKGVQALWSIDMMDDSTDLQGLKIGEWNQTRETYTEPEARALTGYLGDIARELLDEARA